VDNLVVFALFVGKNANYFPTLIRGEGDTRCRSSVPTSFVEIVAQAQASITKSQKLRGNNNKCKKQ